MYVVVENDKVVLKMYDDGTFTVTPKEKVKKEFNNNLSALKNGFITTEAFERHYGIDKLKKEAIKRYKELLPEIETAVRDFEKFMKMIEFFT